MNFHSISNRYNTAIADQQPQMLQQAQQKTKKPKNPQEDPKAIALTGKVITMASTAFSLLASFTGLISFPTFFLISGTGALTGAVFLNQSSKLHAVQGNEKAAENEGVRAKITGWIGASLLGLSILSYGEEETPRICEKDYTGFEWCRKPYRMYSSLAMLAVLPTQVYLLASNLSSCLSD